MTALRNVDTGWGVFPTSRVSEIDSTARRPVHWVERVFHEQAFNSMAGFFASVDRVCRACLAAMRAAAMHAAGVSVSPWRFDGRSTPRVGEAMLKDAM